MTRVVAALVHHPCVDKHGGIYTTSVTNLDVHDIARTARTYDLAAFYVVTPVTAQQEMVRAITQFWEAGRGAARNPCRTEAMQRVHVVASLEDVIAHETEALRKRPWIVATSAKQTAKAPWSHARLRERFPEIPGMVLVFGTGHGLAPNVIEMADVVLEPIVGRSDYNHLSVRSAAAIIIDRLLEPGTMR